MKRYFSVCAIALLGLGALFALNSLRANDDKQAPALQKDEISEVVELVDRIEELEKRLAKLEGREPLIRQADSREASNVDNSVPHPPAMTPFDDDQEVDDKPQNTNGQVWRFRLLNHRRDERGNGSPTMNVVPVPNRSHATGTKTETESPSSSRKNET